MNEEKEPQDNKVELTPKEFLQELRDLERSCIEELQRIRRLRDPVIYDAKFDDHPARIFRTEDGAYYFTNWATGEGVLIDPVAPTSEGFPPGVFSKEPEMKVDCWQFLYPKTKKKGAE